MTYLEKFNKLLRKICQLETNKYYFNAQILNQFIAELKDKLIKKVCSHAPKDLATAIQQAKNYEMAIEEANRTKLVNLAIGETSSAAEKKIDQLTKKLQQNQQNRSNQRYPPSQQSYYQPPLPAYYPLRPQYQNNYYQPAPQPIQQQYQQPPTQHYQVSARRLITQNQFTPQNQYQVNNNRISSNNQLVPRNFTKPRPNHYHTQLSYLTMPEEQDFHHTALSEDRAAAQQQNPSHNHTTILPTRIAKNANLSNIFSFEFEANESPFLLSNAAANKQKAITAMYTKAELMQQLKRNVDQPAQTVIVIANGMKKTPVGEIDNFLFTLDGITIPVKVFVMNAPQYQALVGNDWLQKANVKLDWKTQKLQISYQGQHARVSATCGTFNKCSKKAPAFEFEPEEEKPIIKTFMALGERVCDQTCQYALSIVEKVKCGTSFNTTYNSALNKLYHYPYDAEMIYELAMVLINGGTKEDVLQMKEAKYIEYTLELAEFNYENEVEVYYQITSHTYLTQEAQIQQLEQMNIKLCEDKSNEYKIEFGELEATKEIETTPIYFIKNQFASQLKYFNNNGQGIKPEKAHEIDAGYNLQYSGKDTLVLQPNSLTKINLKIAFEIPPGAMVQIAS
ncbi:hypothetical protein G9A89_017659 [Geosiphon pyriformis]|nr:hypothetical protein G9A89_017659 [Geosiphon pyriformis]